MKRIPIAAGLGGGSSNAATTLKALNELLRLDLPRRLSNMGLKLGQMFLSSYERFCSWLGDRERLRQVQLPELWYVLINPNFEVSTASVYRKVILTKMRFHYRIQKFFKSPEEIFLFFTMIWRSRLEEHPEINEMKKCLNAAGLRPLS